MKKHRTLEISKIIRDDDINTRTLDNSTVKNYKESMEIYGEKDWQRKWNASPKITEDNILWSGFHTVQAALEQFGEKHRIQCEIEGENRRDAFFLATGENATHGKPRTNKEKKEAVMRWLLDDEMKQWSNSHIAKKCFTSVPFVSSLVEKLIKDIEAEYERPAKLKQIDRYGNITEKDYSKKEDENEIENNVENEVENEDENSNENESKNQKIDKNEESEVVKKPFVFSAMLTFNVNSRHENSPLSVPTTTKMSTPEIFIEGINITDEEFKKLLNPIALEFKSLIEKLNNDTDSTSDS